MLHLHDKRIMYKKKNNLVLMLLKLVYVGMNLVVSTSVAVMLRDWSSYLS